MRYTTIFFDLDNTLYPPNTGLWKIIKQRMSDYMQERMNIPDADIPRLREKYYREYGTTLRGLQAHHHIDEDDFLDYVHDLPLKDYIAPNPTLRSIIGSLPTRNIIFTNADMAHAKRVLRVLELDDLFPIIIDIKMISPYCKPMPESFKIAMEAAGETAPSRCVMIDDIPDTTRSAHEQGLFSILYEGKWTDGDADAYLTNWDDLQAILENGGS